MCWHRSHDLQCLSIVDASIENLQNALIDGRINSVQLLAKHLHRVAQYDRRTPRLNAIPVLNTNAFEDAEASDDYRGGNNGSIRSLLEGIPFTAKDSFMMKGLPVAAESPAFRNLTAGVDAFTVGAIRSAGGIPLGKTNMPPMANGGMQRGLYGRAESPYNSSYLAAAMGSGSSNGCGVSTASSMAAFGLAEETVSSGRSPASNNGLVAYTPSRGMLSIRGNWPLTCSADVVVPHARSVKDLMTILDVNSEYPLPSYFNGSASPGDMDAYAWDDFLHMVNDTSSVTTLADVDPGLIFPQLPRTIPDRYGNRFGNRTQSNARSVEAVKNRTGKIIDIPGLAAWLQRLEGRRERDLEDWMDKKGLDAVVWPANGDVGRERAEVDNEAAVPT
uniref:Amidase n=1 Tax=Colletotrichum fructicola (strain Nara gc5) TaxID=1213859 RepID=L2FA87_COLFN